MECKAIPSDEIISGRRIDCINRLKTEPSEDWDRKKTKRAWFQKSNNGMIDHVKYNRSSDCKLVPGFGQWWPWHKCFIERWRQKPDKWVQERWGERKWKQNIWTILSSSFLIKRSIFLLIDNYFVSLVLLPEVLPRAYLTGLSASTYPVSIE